MDTNHARSRATLLGMAIATCCAPAANATIVYNGPATYVINSTVTDNVVVNNASAVLNVESGGVVTGVADPSTLGAVRTQAGTLNVTGNGQINSGGNANAISMRGNPAVVHLRDQSSVTGDIRMDFSTPGWRDESTARVKLYAQDQATVTGDVIYAGWMRVADQARIDGDIRNAANGSVSLDMRGGEVTGQVSFGSLNEYVFNLSGGSILGGFRGDAGYLDLDVSGGYIGNGFRTGNYVNGVVSGGQIEGGIDIAHVGGVSNLVFTGGVFDADPGDYLFSLTSGHYPGQTSSSTLDILGGQWGYAEAGLGFYLDEFVDFSISGWDLTFTNGLLSGYLSDGNWFSNYFTFGGNWQGAFTINNSLAALSATTQSVPEPGTLGLLLASAAGMMFARRRRA